MPVQQQSENNASREDIAAIIAERNQHFHLQWFKDLFSGRLSLGDTFWLGYLGSTLIITPVTFVMAVLARGFLPDTYFSFGLAIWFCLLGFYYITLFIAVARKALSTPEAKGWRWAAVLFALLATMGFLTRIYAYLITI
ncbi:hypothetical protein HBA92_18865 [Ochrobactrum sp. MR28]|nr:hypothetical protein [Ochrobactrum sp. MR28]MBX8818346.1 hypothetical protein [Ochrobactrum sp. MR31]